MNAIRKKRINKNPNLVRVLSNPDFTKTNPIFSSPGSPIPRASLNNTPELDDMYKTLKDPIRGNHILSLQIPRETPKNLKKISHNPRKEINIYKSYPSPSRKSTPSTMSQISSEQTKLLSIRKENKSLISLVNRLENELTAVLQDNMRLAKNEEKCRNIELEIENAIQENEFLKINSSENEKNLRINRLEKVMNDYKIKLARALERVN